MLGICLLGCGLLSLVHSDITQDVDKPVGQTVDFVARSRPLIDGKPVIRSVKTRWRADKTAVVICDMWARHWCDSAARRGSEMSPRMNAFVSTLRKRGVLIIHCPSSGVKYYEDTPMRALAKRAPVIETPIPLKRWCALDKKREGPLPIDDSDDGCDCTPRCPKGEGRMNRHQTPLIKIHKQDAITDNAEAYYLMRQRGITNVIVVGVHTNMCVLGRPFSIRQMIYQRQNVVLVRDLTDTMYNPRSRPFVSHVAGTALVIEHIERYWCPTMTSSEVLGGESFQFTDAKNAPVKKTPAKTIP